MSQSREAIRNYRGYVKRTHEQLDGAPNFHSGTIWTPQ